MFSVEELRAQVPALVTKPIPPMQIIQFEADDFPSFSSEENITICRGRKSAFESALHFWVAAVRCEDWRDREEHLLSYLSNVKCQPLEERQFLKLTEGAQSLKIPFTVTLGSKYLWGYEMDLEIFEYCIMAELEAEFLYYHWWTTA